MALTLSQIPGFADVPDTDLEAGDPALGVLMSRISQNASFGMVRLEVFAGNYANGETVGIPQSSIDGYVYDRSELTYYWGVVETLNQSTGWITGPDSLWYAAWKVDQNTGLVSAEEWYRRSGSHYQGTQSNDGLLRVYTVAQRARTTLILAAPANSYVDVPDSGLVTDGPLTQAIAQGMNDNAKFGVLQAEFIYMGEFYDGQTVPLPVSPADGYAYTRSEVRLMHSWRWTTAGNATLMTQPPLSYGQLGPISVAIDHGTGALTIHVWYIDDSGNLSLIAGYGRVAIFAACSRSDLISGGIPGTASAFSEIDVQTLMPGQTLRASTMQQLNKNIRESAVNVEFFGPNEYHNGDTVPTPVSAIDGYAYGRQEIFYLWEWDNTSPQTGTNLRVAAFYGSVSYYGVVSLTTIRLPPGGPYDTTTAYCSILLTVVAIRGANKNINSDPSSGSNQPGSSGSSFDNNPPDINPYAITFDMGGGRTSTPGTGESLLKHVIPANLTSVTLVSALTGSVAGCRTAPTGSYAITINKNGTAVGTINFSAGSTSATFSFSGSQTLVPGDVLEFVGGTQDATILGIYFTLSGTRT